ncbi:MAG: nlhH [Alphaproteobacteria bacterium]|nr:nlhH [Alphaproteobacteria bacterium]
MMKILSLALALFLGNGAAMAAAPDPLDIVNPELRASARQMEQMKFPPLSEAELPKMRSMSWGPDQPLLADIPISEHRIPRSPGGGEVLVYVVNAAPGKARPGILHTHGGGYVMGSAKSDIRDLQLLAKALDCVIVTVEYRLAPETRFAGSIEDNYAGLRWMHGHAPELGVDKSRIAVMGESAGGGHAALLALAARDRREIPILFEMLVYPMLDDRTGGSRPVPTHIGQLVWNAQANRFGWQSFLGRAPGGDAPPGGVPARVENLKGLPPTFIGVGSIDLFVGEDIDYARRLIDAGVPTELLVVPGAFHGFDVIARDTDVARRFTEAKIAALRRAFAAAADAPRAPDQGK